MEWTTRGLGFTVNKMNFFNKKQSGLTLLEALVSTAIVGIGFVAIFQMVNFSVQSINTSGERTKANYLVSMIAEDIIGYRNTIYGANTSEENIVYFNYLPFKNKNYKNVNKKTNENSPFNVLKELSIK